MTSGPEHYRPAERYAAEAADRLTSTHGDPAEATPWATLAEVLEHTGLASWQRDVGTAAGLIPAPDVGDRQWSRR